jgi:serine/threonine-protein kinase ULK3
VLYDHNITHRDIKAQNILIKGSTAKLADFGFAKELREKDTQEDGTGVGTILYMAPQLILHDKPQYSIRCDVWSIGVVMYFVRGVGFRCFTGTFPGTRTSPCGPSSCR